MVSDLLANSVVEILLQETLAQFFPIVHTKGAAKCFSPK